MIVTTTVTNDTGHFEKVWQKRVEGHFLISSREMRWQKYVEGHFLISSREMRHENFFFVNCDLVTYYEL